MQGTDKFMLLLCRGQFRGRDRVYGALHFRGNLIVKYLIINCLKKRRVYIKVVLNIVATELAARLRYLNNISLFRQADWSGGQKLLTPLLFKAHE